MKRFFNAFAMLFSLALLILSSSCAMGADGSLLIRMPGARSRETIETAYKFILELDGPTKITKEASQGELVQIDNLLAGDYEITCTAKDGDGYFYADGSAKTVVKPNEISRVGLALHKRVLEPEITLQPEDSTVDISADGAWQTVLSISAKVNQRGELKFQWYRQSSNGQWIEDSNNDTGNDGAVNQNAGQVGSSSNTSIKGYVQKSDSHSFIFKEAGEYKVKCVVSNNVGNDTKSAESRVCRIVVKNQTSTVAGGDEKKDETGEGSTGSGNAGNENGSGVVIVPAGTTIYNDWSNLSAAISGVSSDDEATFYVSGELESSSCIDITGKKVTILADSNGCTIKRTSSNNQSFFNIKDNGELTLGGDNSGLLILDGCYSAASDSIKSQKALITAMPDTNGSMKLNLLKNCTLQNNYNTNTSSASNNSSNFGGGVCFVSSVALSSDSGLFIDGAIIQNCYAKFGGGVYFASGTSLNKIDYNGVNSYSDSLFELKNGIINENTSYCENVSSVGNGGGVYLYKGLMKISGGEIKSNKQGEILKNMQTGCGGAGIFYKSDAAIVMEGGSVTGNIANMCPGGGISGGTNHLYIMRDSSASIYGNSVTAEGIANRDEALYDNIYPSFYFTDDPTTTVTLKRGTTNVSIKNGQVSAEQ